ncbi:MAG: hypothetical protein MHMPM18_003039 [Marteilia pararefringens]
MAATEQDDESNNRLFDNEPKIQEVIEENDLIIQERIAAKKLFSKATTRLEEFIGGMKKFEAHYNDALINN